MGKAIIFNAGNSGAVGKSWSGTKAEYDALGKYDSEMTYSITDENGIVIMTVKGNAGLTHYKEYLTSEDVDVLITTIPTTGWSSGAPYTIQINVAGVKESMAPIIGLVQSDDAATRAAQREAWSSITRITTHDGYIKVYADEAIPTTELTIQIKSICVGGSYTAFWEGTQEEYNALGSYDGSTLYMI